MSAHDCHHHYNCKQIPPQSSAVQTFTIKITVRVSDAVNIRIFKETLKWFEVVGDGEVKQTALRLAIAEVKKSVGKFS